MKRPCTLLALMILVAPFCAQGEGSFLQRTIRLVEGENWVTFTAIPGSNTVREVFQRDVLPSGSSMIDASRIAWHDAQEGYPTNMIWLDAIAGWRFASGGPAGHYAIPLDESCSIFIPPGSGTTNLLVNEWIRSDRFEGAKLVQELKGSGEFTVVSFKMPMALKLNDSGLREAGFTGAPKGEKVNPNNSDELRIMQDGGNTLAAPKVRILMNEAGQFVYWSGGPFLKSAEAYTIHGEDMLVIHTTRSPSNLYWKVQIPPASSPK